MLGCETKGDDDDDWECDGSGGTPTDMFGGESSHSDVGDADVSDHSTCVALNDRGIISRLDNIGTDNKELFALDGHCLEATHSLAMGSAWGVRFAPETPEGEVPDFDIQFPFIPVHTIAPHVGHLQVGSPRRVMVTKLFNPRPTATPGLTIA